MSLRRSIRISARRQPIVESLEEVDAMEETPELESSQ